MTRPVVHLRPGETALFGYGSLISRRSLETTLGTLYDGPYLSCMLRGWRRTWDAAMANDTFFYLDQASRRVYPEFVLYLNVVPDRDRAVNGMIFIVNARALDDFDRRESIYDRVPITDALEGVRVEGGAAFVYVARPECTRTGVASPDRAAVRRSYLRILEEGLAAQGPQFRVAYDASSDAPPAALIIDDQRGRLT